MTQWHIVVAEPFDAEAMERVRAVGRVTQLGSCDSTTMIAAVGDADALLVRTVARVGAELLNRAPRLRVIGRGGVGLENIDLDAARARGVQVVYTPQAATDAVADLTVGLMLALERRIVAADNAVRRGQFNEAREASTGRELSTMKLGVVGMGRIGQAVARRCCLGFGMEVFFNDIVVPGPLGFPATACSKEELYAASDIVTLHVPLTNLTRRMIDAYVLSRFKFGSLLINTCRGGVVDNEALAAALESGPLGGAALDVFEIEPLPMTSSLLKAANAVFTPHLAARTSCGLRRMNAVVEDVIAVLQGRAPEYPA